MSAERWEQVKQLFHEALVREPSERAAFLDGLGEADPSLRKEVESLLASHNEQESFLAKPPIEKVGDSGEPQTEDTASVTRVRDDEEDSTEGRQIGPYRILQELGHGGMGVVYEAEQEKPVHRRVALKLIKLGMDTKQVIARFESERQALALMNHPSIASVYDAGATAQGRPYFAMEYVQGIPITEYCDKHRLRIKERLDLFIAVCEGVQHAHQKGIIHRDIKPSNVLVTIQDDKPVPKIIDFGVAKATAQRLTERTVYTELGQFIGTPEYMSPEQAEMTGLDIDTRTDVYSLGVILYELLVGAQPFDATELRKAGFEGVRRIIREKEPPKPSTKVHSLGKTTTDSAKKRRLEPQIWERELRGDLDWITMKALEKDRTRRYGSPVELAADIRRHLNHEPIMAVPPRTTYRMRKFVRRHRLAVAATTLVFFALVVGLSGATIGMIRATKAERQVRAEAAKTNAINEFLQDILGSADPRFGLGREVTVVEALDAATGKIDESFRDEPEIGAAVRQTMGTTYKNLGRYERSAELFRSALEMRKETLGSLHPDVVESMSALANIEAYRNDTESAKALFREALSISKNFSGNERLKRADALNSLGNIILNEGDYESAKQLYSESYAIFRDIQGSESHFALVVLHNLASAAHRGGDYDSAESLLREVLQQQRKALGEEHPDVAMTMTNLANVLYDKGDYEAAEDLHRRAVSMATKLEGDSHPSLRFKLSSQAKLLVARGKHEEAVSVFDQSLKIGSGGTKQEEELRAANRRSWFGSIMREFNYFEKAEHYLVAALNIQMTHLGKNDEMTQLTISRLLELYESWGKPEKADQYRAILSKE